MGSRRSRCSRLSRAGARYALFQHMIGNHDWSMRAGPVGKECCHNAELIGPPRPATLIPIPYDFDFSGLVDAPYATPPEGIPIDRRPAAHSTAAIASTMPQALAVARADARRARRRFLGRLRNDPGPRPDATQAQAPRRLLRGHRHRRDSGKIFKRCVN